MRTVEKVICVIKARRSDGTAVLLTYQSDDWRMSLFPNVNLPSDSVKDIEVIQTLLAERIGVRPETLTLHFDRRDESRTSRTVKRTADPEKAQKYGPEAEYIFHYAEASIENPPEHLHQRVFTHKEVTFMWRSLPSLKADAAVREHNSDVLEYLSGAFDQTLMLLADSFENEIVASPFGVEDRYDAFICHAHEDKPFVRRLANALQKAGLNVWFDEFVLNVGDSLHSSIERGLARSRAGVVVVSPSFFRKRWPQRELEGIVVRVDHGDARLLPVWHNITAEEVTAHSPMLAGLFAVKSSDSLKMVVRALIRSIGTK